MGRLTNSVGFLGGLYLPTGAVVDPVRMLRYLAKASDVDVFEYAASEKIVPGAGGVVVETERISFNAPHVLVATNAYTPLLLGPQDLPLGTIRPIRAQMLATSPVQPVLTMPVYSHDGFYYIRQHQSGRILLGGARHLHEPEEVGYVDSVTAGLQSDLEEYLRVHFPEVRPHAVESRWSGTMGFSPDSRPLFSSIRDVPGAHWIGGFTGHGMSVAFRAGLLAARSLLGRDDEYADLFDAARLTK